MASSVLFWSPLKTWRSCGFAGALATVLSAATIAALLPVAAGANSVPSVPGDVAASVDGATIDVSWSASTDPDSPIAGYNIYVDGEYTTTVRGALAHSEEVHGRTGELAFQVTAFDDNEPKGFSPMSEVAFVELSAGVSEVPDGTVPEPAPVEQLDIANINGRPSATELFGEIAPAADTPPVLEQPTAPEPQTETPTFVPDQTPTAPTGVTVARQAEQLLLGWDVSAYLDGEIAGYNIYRNGTYETTVGDDPLSEEEATDAQNQEFIDEYDDVVGYGIFTAAVQFRGSQLSGSEVELSWSRPMRIDAGIEPPEGWAVGYNVSRDGTHLATLAPDTAWDRTYIDDIAGIEGAHTYAVVPFVNVGDQTAFGLPTPDVELEISLPEDQPLEDLETCPSGRTKNLIVAGDSWADRVGPFLQQTFSSRGWNVAELGVGSTLSRDWLPGTDNYRRILFELAISGGTCVDNTLSFSVGGNDLVLPDGGANAFPQTNEDVAQRLGQAAQNILTTIDGLREYDPNLRVVIPGYDLVNPNVTAACLTAANVIACQPGQTFDPARANDRQAAILQTYQRVAAARPNVVAANLLGTTQGRPGNPDFSSLPPVVYSSSDCIHLTGGPASLVSSGGIAPFEEPFGFNGYEIWGSELAMVIDPTLSLTYQLDLSPDAERPPLDDPFGEPLLPDGGLPQDLIVFEAENYTTIDSAGWGRGGAVGAVGESSLSAVVSLAGPDSSRLDGGKVSYEIPVPSAGSYDLFIRRRAVTEGDDQLSWGFDGVQQPGEGLGGSLGSNFTWVYLGGVELQAGVRVLDFGRLEGELVLDRVALVRPGIMPLGDGGSATLVPRRAISSDAENGNSLSIDYNQLLVADAGEEGFFENGDEPRLVVIEFRTTPGKVGSTVVTSSFRYDGPTGRDDGDVWQIPDNIGRFEYKNFKAINEAEIRAGELPELIGHLVVLLEDEPFGRDAVKDRVQKVADELERALQTVIEPLDPVSIAADPRGLAESVTVASGLVVEASEPYDNPGISDTLESSLRDIGGADVVGFFPMFFLSVDESLTTPIDAAFAEQLQGVPAAGGALRDRSFQISRRGSGATYVVDVEVKVGN